MRRHLLLVTTALAAILAGAAARADVAPEDTDANCSVAAWETDDRDCRECPSASQSCIDEAAEAGFTEAVCEVGTLVVLCEEASGDENGCSVAYVQSRPRALPILLTAALFGIGLFAFWRSRRAPPR